MAAGATRREVVELQEVVDGSTVLVVVSKVVEVETEVELEVVVSSS